MRNNGSSHRIFLARIKKGNSGIKCYNCNERGHISTKCPKPQRKPRCSKCSRIGHSEADCNSPARKTHVQLIRYDENHKRVIINGHHDVMAFVDTGSDVSIMTKRFAEKRQLQWEPYSISLNGFGNGKCFTLGRCRIHLEVDTVAGDVFALIVDDNVTTLDFILGRDFIDQEHVVMIRRKGELTLCNDPPAIRGDNDNTANTDSIVEIVQEMTTEASEGIAKKKKRKLTESEENVENNGLDSTQKSTTEESGGPKKKKKKKETTDINDTNNTTLDTTQEVDIEENGDVKKKKKKKKTGDSRKLEAKYKGPYIIAEVLPNDRYRVKDIPGAPRTQRSFESVFASDSLKPWCTNPDVDSTSDQSDDSDGFEDESFHQEGRAVNVAKLPELPNVGTTDKYELPVKLSSSSDQR